MKPQPLTPREARHLLNVGVIKCASLAAIERGNTPKRTLFVCQSRGGTDWYMSCRPIGKKEN